VRAGTLVRRRPGGARAGAPGDGAARRGRTRRRGDGTHGGRRGRDGTPGRRDGARGQVGPRDGARRHARPTRRRQGARRANETAPGHAKPTRRRETARQADEAARGDTRWRPARGALSAGRRLWTPGGNKLDTRRLSGEHEATRWSRVHASSGAGVQGGAAGGHSRKVGAPCGAPLSASVDFVGPGPTKSTIDIADTSVDAARPPAEARRPRARRRTRNAAARRRTRDAAARGARAPPSDPLHPQPQHLRHHLEAPAEVARGEDRVV
jgi:hypothetical protein